MARCGIGQAERLASFVLPIAVRTYAKWVEPQSASTWAETEHGARAWDSRLADPATHVVAVERENDSIAACAFVRLTTETAFFGGLYVEDTGRGLGSFLRDERIRISREAGALTALMLIRETNAPARALAEKAGFAMVAEDPCTRLAAVPRLVYRLTLNLPAPVPPKQLSNPDLNPAQRQSISPTGNRPCLTVSAGPCRRG